MPNPCLRIMPPLSIPPSLVLTRSLPTFVAFLKHFPSPRPVPLPLLSPSPSSFPTLFSPLSRSTFCLSFAASVALDPCLAGSDSRTSQVNPRLPQRSVAGKDEDTFFADSGVTWKSLGLSQEIVDALERAHFQHPSAVQGAAIPAILTDADVVMAAETGSGKTQAYLAPLFHKVWKRQQQSRKEAEKQPVSRTYSQAQHFVLVLCPNAMLCEQVAQMANALCDSCGTPLLKVAVVCGGQGWPIAPPDVVIVTPAALLNNLFAFDPRRRRRNAFIRDVKYVVFDEADMLLSGGFESQVTKLLNMFRLEEKQLSKSGVEDTASETLDSRPWTDFEPAESSLEDESAVEDLDRSIWTDEDPIVESAEAAKLDQTSEPGQKKDWLRSRKVYTRSKQYIFSAATLPENGRKTPGAVLKRFFPEAKWVNGLFLHRHNPRLQERWVEVDANTQIDALLNALSDVGSSGVEASPKKTLVFANSVEAVDAICRILRKAGVMCLCYHRDVPSEERMQSLQVFHQEGGVLVCTDAAARGLDIPNIGHVIQAEFAKSAVEFLHRVGRTARAGHSGMVTSLYTEANRPLVEAVRQAEAAGQPVEGAFSRKRSFRNKLKKSGMASQYSL